eukprot:s1213_g1.t1
MDLVPFLVEQGAKIDDAVALLNACEAGHPSVVRYLLEAGVDKNSRGFHDGTPLLLAVVSGNHMVVDVLLDAKVDVNVRDVRGWTPLMQAAATAAPLVKRLLDAAADVKQRDVHGGLDTADASSGHSCATCQEADEAIVPELKARAGVHMAVQAKREGPY